MFFLYQEHGLSCCKGLPFRKGLSCRKGLTVPPAGQGKGRGPGLGSLFVQYRTTATPVFGGGEVDGMED